MQTLGIAFRFADHRPMTGSVRILDLVQDRMVTIRCSRCSKEGRYRLHTLLHRFGHEKRIPDMLTAIRNSSRCPRRGDNWEGCSLAITGHNQTPDPQTVENPATGA